MQICHRNQDKLLIWIHHRKAVDEWKMEWIRGFWDLKRFNEAKGDTPAARESHLCREITPRYSQYTPVFQSCISGEHTEYAKEGILEEDPFGTMGNFRGVPNMWNMFHCGRFTKTALIMPDKNKQNFRKCLIVHKKKYVFGKFWIAP